MEVVTVPRVPILRTGHFELESGPVDFAQEHLTAAATALANDPAVLPGRIRLELPDQGHLDADSIAVEASGGQGGPAVGWMDNYEVDGNTLYADLHVPELVAASMEWAFPARSVEGLFGWTTATGATHDFVATGLLLLGTSWPGVTTLPDFAEVQAEFATAVAAGEVTVAAAGFAAVEDERADPLTEAAPVARMAVTARAPRELAQAGLSVGDLRMRWYGAEAAGDLDGLPDTYDVWSWYVLESRVDDDGQLYVVVLDDATGEQWRFDVASITGTDVTFAAPSRGSLDWSTAAASAPVRPVLGRYAGRPVQASSSPAGSTTTEDDTPMTDAQRQALATSLGLDPATATEADVHAAAEQRAANPPAADAAPGSPEGTPPEGTPEAPVAPAVEPVPEGVAARTSAISTDVLADLQARAARGDAAAARQTHGDRDRQVLAALEAGRITPAESGLGALDPTTGLYAIAESGWRRDLEDAPEVTARALDRLEAGKYPGAQAARGAQPAAARGDSLGRVLASIRPNASKEKVG